MELIAGKMMEGGLVNTLLSVEAGTWLAFYLGWDLEAAVLG